MPMYRHKISRNAYEARTCHKENRKDIESWAGIKKAKIGKVYQRYGYVDKDWLEDNFIEQEPCI